MPALAEALRARIATQGPIPLADYMAMANAAYYARGDPLGVAGDFITAPEISQMFGELVGVWLAEIWQRAGRPAPVCYVELGPGRGTLARDALGVMARFGLTPHVHLIETSPALRALQAARLPGAHWHESLATLPSDAPLLVVANEFLDALPVRQLQRTPTGWRAVMVRRAGEGFAPCLGDAPVDAEVPAAWRAAPMGTVIELSPAAEDAMAMIAGRIARQGGAALIIDYGPTTAQLGSTLQAVRAHARADPFAAPGTADLTAHVDFAAMHDAAMRAGARWLGTVPQGAWLEAMGIGPRAARLADATPTQRETIVQACTRLTHPEAMGSLFKVMGLAAPTWPDGAGFL